MRWLLLTLFLFVGCHEFNGPKPTRNMQKAFSTFCKKEAKKYDLQFLNIGLKHIIGGERAGWGASFISAKKMSVEESLLLSQYISRDLKNELSSKSVYEKWRNYAVEKHKKFYPNKEFQPDIFGFKISFWDKHVNRPLSPYVAQIRFVDEQFKIYFADPDTQALIFHKTVR